MSTDHARYGDIYLEEIRILKEQVSMFNEAVNVAQAKQAHLEDLLKLSISPCRLVAILNEQRDLFCGILERCGSLDPNEREIIIDGMHRVQCDHLHAKGSDPDDGINGEKA